MPQTVAGNIDLSNRPPPQGITIRRVGDTPAEAPVTIRRVEETPPADTDPRARFGAGFMEDSVANVPKLLAGIIQALTHPIDTATGLEANAVKHGLGAIASTQRALQPRPDQHSGLADNLLDRGSEAANALTELVSAVLPGTAETGNLVRGVNDARTEAVPPDPARALGKEAAFVTNLAVPTPGPKIANAAAGPIEDMSISAWKRAAKVPIPIVKKTAAYRATGDLTAGESQIAKDAMTAGRGRLSAANAEAARQDLSAAGRAKGAAVAASNAVMPRRLLLDTMDNVIAQTVKSEPFAEGPVKQLAKLRAQLLDLPPQIPIADAEALLEGIYKKNEAAYGPGVKSPVQVTAEKAIGRTIKDFADTNVPGVTAANAAYGKAKPVALAVSRGAWRAGHQNPLSLPEILAALTGGAAGGWKGAATGYALGAAQRPGPLSTIAQTLFDLSQKMKK